MKITTKKILSTGLALGVLFSLGACSKSGKESTGKTDVADTSESETEIGSGAGAAVDLFEESGNSEDRIHIGDYVAYNEGSITYKDKNGKEINGSDGTMKWRVIGIEDNKLKLVADDSAKGDYVTREDTPDICAMFGKGEGAESARCISDQDFKDFVSLDEITPMGVTRSEIWTIADTTDPLYDVIFKNENGLYVEFRFDSDVTSSDGKAYGMFSANGEWGSICQFCDVYDGGILPVVYLKSDVEFDGKDETGAWKIAGAEKTYSEIQYVEIASADDLMKLTDSSADLSANYILTNDIDLSGIENYPMIGNFKGIFNGNGHKITGLKIKSDSIYVGLFAQTSNAFIKDLTIENAEIISEGTQEFGTCTGILLGQCTGTEVLNCVVSGTITMKKETMSNDDCGLLAGSFNSGDIMNTSVSGTINAENIGTCGGFVGVFFSHPIIENCFADVNISATNVNYLGGFAGSAFNIHAARCGVTNVIAIDGKAEHISGFSNTDDKYNSTYLCYAKNDITYSGKDAYIGGFGISSRGALDTFNCYCTGNIKTVLPAGSTDHDDSFIYSFCDRGCFYNSFSNMDIDAQKVKMFGFDFMYGNLIFNSETSFDEVDPDDYHLKGELTGISSADFKNKDTFKDYDFDKMWKWDDSESTIKLIYE